MLVNVVIYATMPALVFTIIAHERLSATLLLVPVAGYLIHVVMLGIGWLMARSRHADRPTEGAMLVSTGVGNTGLLRRAADRRQRPGGVAGGGGVLRRVRHRGDHLDIDGRDRELLRGGRGAHHRDRLGGAAARAAHAADGRPLRRPGVEPRLGSVRRRTGSRGRWSSSARPRCRWCCSTSGSCSTGGRCGASGPRSG